MEPRSRCNNAIHVLNHFKKLGVEESAILNGVSVDKEYLSKPHNWITVKDWYKLMDNCQEAAPLTTLTDWYKIGFYLKDNEESKHGIQINFSNEIEKPLNLKDSLQTILYRSVRELFMNTIKHSKSNKVLLKTSMGDNFLHINFEDNGIGFDSSILKNNSTSSFGLFSIIERIKILNGQVKIDSESGKGTRIEIIVPLGEQSNNLQT